MLSKKSQIFIFILVGIILIITFIFLFMISYSFYKTNLKKNVVMSNYEKSVLVQIETSIEDCLELSANEALLVVGRQGGYVYTNQGGFTSLPREIFGVNATEYVDLGDFKATLPYWILRNPYDLPPSYPRYGFFGFQLFPYLRPEDVRLNNKPITIKDQLENYAKLRFENCFNLSRFNTSVFKNKIVVKHEPEVKVTFSSKTTRFKLDYPLLVYGRNIGSKVFISDVAFKAIYLLARNAVSKDTNNLTFIIDNINFLSNPMYPRIVLERVDGKDYDVIIIRDYGAKFYAGDYSFYFLRQNRNPVLMNIPIIDINISDKFSFSPFAFDPDEDVLNLSIVDLESGVERKGFVFEATPYDIGNHYFNVTVVDPAGLKDWQENVLIRVHCQKDYSGHLYDSVCCADDTLSFKTGQCGPGLYCDTYGKCRAP